MAIEPNKCWIVLRAECGDLTNAVRSQRQAGSAESLVNTIAGVLPLVEVDCEPLGRARDLSTHSDDHAGQSAIGCLDRFRSPSFGYAGHSCTLDEAKEKRRN